VPFRVGIDLVEVANVADSVRDYGDRYLDRIYTAGEIADCGTADGLAPERLAARFAAKEAAIKALRLGDEPVPWKEIEVARGPGGWVELELSGRAAALAAEAGILGSAVSLTHEAGFASAVVILEVELGGR
jgi:holo-[acyl-carrier protein] synthase